MGLLEEFTQQKPAFPLYHYTRASGLIGIVKNKEIWATSHAHLNDRQELKIAASILRGALEANASLTSDEKNIFLRLLLEMQSRSFIISFSERPNLLSQWRSYSLGADGYSLGFAPNNPIFNLCANQKSFNLIKCEYQKVRQRALCRELISRFADDYLATTRLINDRPDATHDVPTAIRAFFKRYQWTYLLRLVSASCKHNGFHEECEWRLVSQYPEDLWRGIDYREGRFGVVPYYRFPMTMLDQEARVDQIVIGPTANKGAAREAVREMLANRGFVGTELTYSNIPLRP